MQQAIEGLFSNDAIEQARCREQIYETLETETVDAATQQRLVDRIWGLDYELLDVVLRLINAGPPVGEAWYALIARAVETLAGRDRDERRYAARFLLHVAGGRVGARYSVQAHPQLETEGGWEALVACLADKDNVLRREIQGAIKYTFGHAQCLPFVLESLRTAGQTELLEVALTRALELGRSLSGVAAATATDSDLPYWRVLQMILEGEHDEAAAVVNEKRYFESIVMSLSKPAICKTRNVQRFLPRLLSLICSALQEDPQEKYANAFSMSGRLCARLAEARVDLTPCIEALCTAMRLTKKVGRASPPAATAAICLAQIGVHGEHRGPSLLGELMASKGGPSGFAPFGLAIEAWLSGDETQLWELVRHSRVSVRGRTAAALAHALGQRWVTDSNAPLMRTLLETLAGDATARIAKSAQASLKDLSPRVEQH